MPVQMDSSTRLLACTGDDTLFEEKGQGRDLRRKGAGKGHQVGIQEKGWTCGFLLENL